MATLEGDGPSLLALGVVAYPQGNNSALTCNKDLVTRIASGLQGPLERSGFYNIGDTEVGFGSRNL